MNHEYITIIQGSEIMGGTYKVSLNEFMLLSIALSKIDDDKAPPEACLISIKDFQKVFGVSPNNSRIQLRELARGLQVKPVITYEYDEITCLNTCFERSWFSKVEYDVLDHTSIKVSFSELIEPYFADLKANLNPSMFNNIASLDTSFSVRLYCWLHQSKSLNRPVVLPVAWMKREAGLNGRYEDYRTFRRKVIEPAISKINSKTDLSVTYQAVKKGSSIFSLKFSAVGQKKVSTKPIRTRLPRRPKGTEAELAWARECIGIMSEHDLELIELGYRLEIGDLIKLRSWYQILDDTAACEEIEQEIEERRRVASSN